jgi:hypothetical protein
VLTTHIGGLHPALLLAQHRDDLLLAEPRLLHVRLLTKPDSSSKWQSFRGARHQRRSTNLPVDRISSRQLPYHYREVDCRGLNLARRTTLPVSAHMLAENSPVRRAHGQRDRTPLA